MAFEIKKAVRRALPLQIAFVGPTNSGKTLSALLFAAGLVGPNDKVVVIDTERGRASLYADNKRVQNALPHGFDVIELDSPYHPQRFIEALDAAEQAGYRVCLIDSFSDSWDGPGGCTDIAEKDKGMWNKAKLWNKRLLTRIALSDMHVISCFKAQEKTKIVDKSRSAPGKQEFVELGMQPLCEKNAFYPQLLAFSADPTTHLSTCIKTHDDLADFFKSPHLITPEDGKVVRVWNQGGQQLGDSEQLVKRSRDAALQGVARYREFFTALTSAQKKALASIHEENKRTAEQADKIPVFGSADQPVQWPDAFDGPECFWNGKHLRMNEETGNYVEVSAAHAA